MTKATNKLYEILKEKMKDEIYLIFDLDGTMVSTDEANFLSYQEAIKKVKNIEMRSLYHGNERFTREKLNLIIPNLTAKEFEKIIEIKTNIFYKYLQNTKLNTSILEVLNKFSKTNKIILATNSHKAKADLLLKYYDLFDIFYKRYYKENYNYKENNKYKHIINSLDITPGNIIIFEDSQDEIKKAISLKVSSENIVNPKISGEKNYE